MKTFTQYLLEMYLSENYQLAAKQFMTTNDKTEVDNTISSFKELVNKNKVFGKQRDINYWRKEGFDQFKRFVEETKKQTETADTKANRKRLIKSASNDILTIKKTKNIHLFIPLSKEASCFYAGNKAPWCISTRDGDNYFYFYTVKAKAYVIFLIHDDEIYALVMNRDGKILECQDKQNDNSFPPTKFYSLSGISREQLFEFCNDNSHKIFGTISNNMRKSFKVAFKTEKYDIFTNPLTVETFNNNQRIKIGSSFMLSTESASFYILMAAWDSFGGIPEVQLDCNLLNMEKYNSKDERLILSKLSETLTKDSKKQIFDFVYNIINTFWEDLQYAIEITKDDMRIDPDNRVLIKRMSIYEKKYTQFRSFILNSSQFPGMQPLLILYPDVLDDVINSLNLREKINKNLFG